MGVFGALGGSIAGSIAGKAINKALSTNKKGEKTKYAKYLESDLGQKLNFQTVGAIGGKVGGALLPFNKGGIVQRQAPMIKPRVGYRLSQGINPLIL